MWIFSKENFTDFAPEHDFKCFLLRDTRSIWQTWNW